MAAPRKPGTTTPQSLPSAMPEDAPALRTGFGLTDTEIEAALDSGENAGILQDYFGEAQYRELRQLAQAAARRSVRGGDRVLILPGIMGSKLGYPRLFGVIWADPAKILLGRLAELALAPGARPPGGRIEPMGVILLAYLTLKLRLRADGFDADFWPYDWRTSIAAAGKALAAAIRDEKRDVQIVAHSMGGLVARAALAHVGGPLKRIVMLGTPNAGSFAPVQAFRGVGGTVPLLDRIDQHHNAAELARIFGTFPGLMELMPAPRTSAADLFDLANWPMLGERPAAALLRDARRVQEGLPSSRAGVDMVLIAGVGQETVVDARLADGPGSEFAYTLSGEGDGTVPLKCALLPGATTYYVPGEHGGLPGRRDIQKALPSILATGRTETLPTQPRRGSAPERIVREGDLSRDVSPMAPSLPSLADQRLLLAEFAGPAEVGAIAAADAVPTPVFTDRLVVGRGRERRLELTLVQGDITRVEAGLYVLGLFKNVEPTGAARAIDEAMGGAVSDMVSRRMFSGDVGAVSIVPSGRRALRSGGVAFVGLGPFDRFDSAVLEVAAENLIRTCVASRVDDFAMVTFGGGVGDLSEDTIVHLIRGLLRGLADADGGDRFRGIAICELDPGRFELIRQMLFRLSATTLFDEVELTFREKRLPPLPSPASLHADAPASSRVYLIVREENEQEHDSGFTASVLTSGDKAAIIAGHRTFDPRGRDALGDHLRLLDDIEAMDEAALAAFGDRLGALVLTDSVRQALAHHAGQHLVVVHDAAASRIPWETLRIGGVAPALAGGMSHRYEAADLSVAKWLERRRAVDQFGLLLVIDPTEDLPSARAEGERLKALAATLGASVRLRVLTGREARRSEVLACLASGAFDAVHYAGHAFFDPFQRARSGLRCADGEVLSGADLAGVGNLPALMVFNACEAARIRGEPAEGDRARPDKPEVVRRSVGFAEALLRGGVANFVGTYWPVGDRAAEVFAGVFYRRLLAGVFLDAALRAGREAVRAAGSLDWADYVFYGDPDFRLKSIVPQPGDVVQEVAADRTDAAVRVTLRYDRERAELLGAVPISARPPAMSLEIEEDSSGGWIEVLDAGGAVVHREALPDPHVGTETFSRRKRLTRPGEPEPCTASVELPWPGAGARLTIHARASAPARRRGGAGEAPIRTGGEIGRFDLRPRSPATTRDAAPPVIRRPIWGHANPNALTLAFMAEGFRADEMDRFHAVVTRCVDTFARTEPFASRLAHLSVAEVPIPSAVGGISGTDAGDTPFRARFQKGSLKRVILIDQERAAKMRDRCFSGSAVALVVANTPTYGGSGGASTVFSCDPDWAPDIAIHELGHSLFGLADEYDAAGQSPNRKPVEPNVSDTADRRKLKWAGLVAPNTPLPTQRRGGPAAPGGAVGAYEGAKYQKSGLYRPAPDCRMRTPNQPFCPVCARTIAERLARHRP